MGKKPTMLRATIALAPTFIFPGDRPSRQIQHLLKTGRLRKFGARIYTTDMKTPLDELGRRDRYLIAGKLRPGAVISGRTAFEMRPAADDSIFLSGGYRKDLNLPGLIIRQDIGPGAIEGDRPFMQDLFLPSRARIFLENLKPSRSRGRVSRTVGRNAVEVDLVKIARRGGDHELKGILELARRVAPALDAAAELQVLEEIVEALLTAPTTASLPKAVLKSDLGRAAVSGLAYDARRIELFEALIEALQHGEDDLRQKRRMMSFTQSSFINVSFFDAYFSNYIEGTKFTVEEAASIVFEGHIPDSRPKDAHDVRGTFDVVSSMPDMVRRPETADEFIAILRQRHIAIAGDRLEIGPGLFKSRRNQAGSTLFVDPDLVLGTLHRGFELMKVLEDPFARALYSMFLVAEVHPFNDCNGRVSRATMNSELIGASEIRILIPSVYRNEYLNSLRLLTNHGNPQAYIRVMAAAQKFTASIDFENFDLARAALSAANAFEEPSQAVKLKIPA